MFYQFEYYICNVKQPGLIEVEAQTREEAVEKAYLHCGMHSEHYNRSDVEFVLLNTEALEPVALAPIYRVEQAVEDGTWEVVCVERFCDSNGDIVRRNKKVVSVHATKQQAEAAIARTNIKSAILFHPEWTYSHLCEVPGEGGTPIRFVMHNGELFVRDETADQHDRQGRVYAYQYQPTVEVK